MLSDMLLIGIGVLCQAQFGGMSDKLMGALVGAGALFLTGCSWKLFQRFLRPLALAIDADAGHSGAKTMTRRQAMLPRSGFPG